MHESFSSDTRLENWRQLEELLPSEIPKIGGPDGPFFLTETSPVVDDLGMIAKTEASTEETIVSLMESMKLIEKKPKTPEQKQHRKLAISFIDTMGVIYRKSFLPETGYHGPSAQTNIHNLRLSTKEFDKQPLLSYARQLNERFYPTTRNTDAECIIRLLMHYEFENRE